MGNLDRVVDFRFGSGKSGHCRILELYAKGNIILTDNNYEILALLQPHDYSTSSDKTISNETNGEESSGVVKVAVRQIYLVTHTTMLSLNIDKKLEGDKELPIETENNDDAVVADGLLSCELANAVQWFWDESKKYND